MKALRYLLLIILLGLVGAGGYAAWHFIQSGTDATRLVVMMLIAFVILWVFLRPGKRGV